MTDEPLFWLKQTFLSARKGLDEELATTGLTAAQMGVLGNLWCEDGLEQRMLQERLCVTSPTLTGIVDGLVERGLLERKLSPQDARVKQLFLTPQGQALQEEAHAIMGRFQARLLAGLSTAEIATLKDLLRRIARNAEPCAVERLEASRVSAQAR